MIAGLMFVICGAIPLSTPMVMDFSLSNSISPPLLQLYPLEPSASALTKISAPLFSLIIRHSIFLTLFLRSVLSSLDKKALMTCSAVVLPTPLGPNITLHGPWDRFRRATLFSDLKPNISTDFILNFRLQVGVIFIQSLVATKELETQPSDPSYL